MCKAAATDTKIPKLVYGHCCTALLSRPHTFAAMSIRSRSHARCRVASCASRHKSKAQKRDSDTGGQGYERVSQVARDDATVRFRVRSCCAKFVRRSLTAAPLFSSDLTRVPLAPLGKTRPECTEASARRCAMSNPGSHEVPAFLAEPSARLTYSYLSAGNCAPRDFICPLGPSARQPPSKMADPGLPAITPNCRKLRADDAGDGHASGGYNATTRRLFKLGGPPNLSISPVSSSSSSSSSSSNLYTRARGKKDSFLNPAD
jgi:hypothetical protein